MTGIMLLIISQAFDTLQRIVIVIRVDATHYLMNYGETGIAG